MATTSMEEGEVNLLPTLPVPPQSPLPRARGRPGGAQVGPPPGYSPAEGHRLHCLWEGAGQQPLAKYRHSGTCTPRCAEGRAGG